MLSKRITFRKLITIIILGSISSPVFAAEDKTMVLGNAKNGEKLHTKHCTACHKNEVYTRKNKNVKSFSALAGRVKGCSGQVGANFTREQLQDVTKFLNSSFYKFKR